jgi:TonB-linked SusC/RagA family outer membrane protein
MPILLKQKHMKLKTIFLSVFLLSIITGNLMGQQRNIRGVVTSAADGQTLPGVTITIKGTVSGTVTDLEGNYELTVPGPDAVLVFSFVGMTTREIRVDDMIILNVALEPMLIGLDETVVMAYGTQRRAAITGSVQVVGADKIEQIPIASFDQILQGQIAGVTSVSNSGRPGAAAVLNIRGVGSINAGTQPLYVVDGIPLNSTVSAFVNPLSSINPNDIESVTVLKDASAAAIYGSRAANGVILVTTKRGRVLDRSDITYRVQAGVTSMARDYFDMMNTREKINYEVQLGIRNPNQPGLDSLRRINTDWRQVMFQEGAMNSHELSSRGGTERTRYFLSGSYYYQDGILQRSNFNRITGRLNLDHFISQKLKLGTTITMGFETYDWSVDAEGGYSNNVYNPVFAAYLMNPYEQPRSQDGEWITQFDTYFGNPLRELELNMDQNNNLKLIGNVFAEYEPLENLILRSSLGTDFYDYTFKLYYHPGSIWGSDEGGSVSRGLTRANTLTFTNTARYNYRPLLRHNFSFLAGIESTRNYVESFSGSGRGFPNDKLTQPGVTAVPTGFGGGLSEYSILSYLGGLNYNFDNKYFVDLTFRRDGSSRFGVANRYADFWSAGLSWNAIEENFLKDVNWLNSLKVRGSMGTSGNFNIGNYTHIGLYGFGATYFDRPASFPATPGDDELTWEKSISYNLGVEFSLLDRINSTIEVYKRISDGMLLSVPLSSTTGFSQATRNAGSMYNQGIEATFDIGILNRPVSWNVGANLSYNMNKITSLYLDTDEFVPPNTSIIYRVGESYGVFYTNRYAGVNPANGAPLWYDKDGNITNEFREGDAQVLEGKNFFPPFSGGFNSTLSWNNFQLGVFFSFVQNKWMLNNTRYFIESHGMFATYGQSRSLLDYWREPGQLTGIPSPFNPANSNRFDSRLIENASFLRLRNAVLAYDLPQSWARQTRVAKSLRIYIQGQNLFTWSTYSGFDAEQAGYIELSAYPAVRTISFGIDLGL